MSALSRSMPRSYESVIRPARPRPIPTTQSRGPQLDMRGVVTIKFSVQTKQSRIHSFLVKLCNRETASYVNKVQGAQGQGLDSLGQDHHFLASCQGLTSLVRSIYIMVLHLFLVVRWVSSVVRNSQTSLKLSVTVCIIIVIIRVKQTVSETGSIDTVFELYVNTSDKLKPDT